MLLLGVLFGVLMCVLGFLFFSVMYRWVLHLFKSDPLDRLSEDHD